MWKQKMWTKNLLPRIFSFTGGPRNDPLRSVHVQLKVVQTTPKGKLLNNRSILHINLLSVLNLIGKLSRDTFTKLYSYILGSFAIVEPGKSETLSKRFTLHYFPFQVVNQ